MRRIPRPSSLDLFQDISNQASSTPPECPIERRYSLPEHRNQTENLVCRHSPATDTHQDDAGEDLERCSAAIRSLVMSELPSSPAACGLAYRNPKPSAPPPRPLYVACQNKEPLKESTEEEADSAENVVKKVVSPVSTISSCKSPPPLYEFSSQASSTQPPRSGTNRPMAVCPDALPPSVHENVPLISQPEEQEAELKAANIKLALTTAFERLVYDCMDCTERKPDGSFVPYYKPFAEQDLTLVFESRFESGNLRRVVQIAPYVYDLYIKADFNTAKHTQWFFFSVENGKPGIEYTFNLVNLIKPSSQYSCGMQPVKYSVDHPDGPGWRRHGTKIAYFRNRTQRVDTSSSAKYFTLTFSVTFEEFDNRCYFSYSPPYTYSELNSYLKRVCGQPSSKNKIRRRVLCQTLAGNSCEMLTITSFCGNSELLKKRKGVVISARVHPGESNASWMMKGVIDFLLSDSQEAQNLRNLFVFRLVPMLNPDGVINGNYRCGLSGQDLNRVWENPSRKVNPTIYYTKLMLKRFQEDREVALFVDLHGHSRKKDCFMYGCESRSLEERVFPSLMANECDFFKFSSCNFAVQKSKARAARVVVNKEFGIQSCYTLEAAFSGASVGRLAGKQFTTYNYEEMGHALCLAVLKCFSLDHNALTSTMEQLHVQFDQGMLEEDINDEGSDADEEEEEEQDLASHDLSEQLVPDVKAQMEPEPPARRERSSSLTSRPSKNRSLSSCRKGKRIVRPKTKLKTERSGSNSSLEGKKLKPPSSKAFQAKQVTLSKATSKQRPNTSRFPSI